MGSFKEFFQHINTNNLAEVLKALRELASYYNMELEPRQITAEEVFNLDRAHLNQNTAYNAKCSTRGKTLL